MRNHARPPLALAVSGEHAIFLDLAQDRYFGLPDDANRVLLNLLRGGESDPRTRHILDCTIDIGADLGALRALIVSPGPPATEWIGPETPGTPCWRDRVAVVGHWIATVSTLRLRGLRIALEGLTCACEGVTTKRTNLDRLVIAHRWLERHVTATDACLARSVSLARHALSSGCYVRLVIGVKTDPFEAHCWVQSGDCILNDTLDRVAAFTPILLAP